MILLWNRVLLAATTAPTRHGWFAPLFILLATAVVTEAYGIRTGFLTRTAPLPRPLGTRIWLTAWFIPPLSKKFCSVYRLFHTLLM